MTPRPPATPLPSSPANKRIPAASSSARSSRKKNKYCRSSLEFLDAAARRTAPSPPPTPASSFSTSGSPKRIKRKNVAVSSSLMKLIPGGNSKSSSNTEIVGRVTSATTTTASSHSKRFRGLLHQRLTSPESQSKLDRLRKHNHEISTPDNNVTKDDSMQGEGVAESLVSANQGNANSNIAPTTTTHEDSILGKEDILTSYLTDVPKNRTKKRSSKKSLLEMLENDENLGIAMDDSKQQQQQQRQSQKYRQQHRTPSAPTSSTTPSQTDSVPTTSSTNDLIITPKSHKSLDINNYHYSSHQKVIAQHTSYSPLDYRPVVNSPKKSNANNNGDGDAARDDHDDNDTNDSMLKTYVDQWTTTTTTEQASAEPIDADHIIHSRSIQSKKKVSGERQRKKTIPTKNQRNDEELLDNQSTSVVSSSWDSERYHGGHADGFVAEENGQGREGYDNNDSTDDDTIVAPALDPPTIQVDDHPQGYTYDGHVAGCEGLSLLRTSGENTVQSQIRQPKSSMKEQLEVEYGQLTLLMQELEHKKHFQNSTDNLICAGNDADNEHDSVPLTNPPSTDPTNSSSMATEVDDAQNIQKQLQYEYGRLALLKDELKRKMNLLHVTKGDSDPSNNYRDWSEPLGVQSGTENLAVEYSHLARLERELERTMQLQKFGTTEVNRMMKLPVRGAERGSSLRPETYPMGEKCEENTTKNFADSSPRDDEVAFGEMVYRQRRTQQSMDDEEVVVDQEQYARKRRKIYPLRQDCMDYDYVPRSLDDEEREVGRRRPASNALNKKKKRKRRFVETITRVIHEESEEEGSSSTGGRRGLNYQYHSPRKYHGGNDEEDYYRDDDIFSGGRKHKVKRMRRNLSPSTGSRMPKLHSGKLRNRGQFDEESDSTSSDSDDVRGRTAKSLGKKSTNRRGKHFRYTPSPTTMRRICKIPIQKSRS